MTIRAFQGNFLGGVMACITLTTFCPLAHAGTDKNVRIMIEAARKLEHSLQENRSYLLIKNETIASPVGVIFGYMDNVAACEQIADALSNPVRVGTLKCSPIY